MPNTSTTEALEAEYGDEFAITFVRPISVDEILARLGIPDDTPRPSFTSGDALDWFPYHYENPRQATQVGIYGGWAFIFDVAAHGRTIAPDVLRRLSRDAEVLSVRQILMSTTLVTHARNGKILSTFNSWTFQPPEGEDPAPLTEALRSVGYFTDVEQEATEEGEWRDSVMVLLALERGFGVDLPPDLRSRPLITVPLPAQD